MVQTKKHNDILKVIAIVTMLIDHIGLVFFPQLTILRIIGRIAFPIFAFQLAIGYRFTSNKNKYMLRLWAFALISQIPYMFLFNHHNLNIMFTLLLAVFLIDQIKKGRWVWLPFIVGFAIVAEYVPSIPNINYHWYGLLSPILFYWFYHAKEKALLAQTLLAVAYVLNGGAWIQVFAVLGVLVCLYLPNEKWKIHLNKYFFYWFYPVHLLLLFIILQIVH